MNDDAFARLVAEEVKGNVTTGQRQYLLLPENWTRWQRALTALIDNLDQQLRRLDDKERSEIAPYQDMGDEGLTFVAEIAAEFEQRRKKISRFKFHVEGRLDEVVRRIAFGSEETDEAFQNMAFLRKAIQRHRELMQEFSLEDTAIDRALWNALEGKWEFETITEKDFA